MNIDHPYAIGEWKLMGPTTQTEHFEQTINHNLSLWFILFINVNV